jgi:hypothetical protein
MLLLIFGKEIVENSYSKYQARVSIAIIKGIAI